MTATRLHRERLVELEQVDVVEAPSRSSSTSFRTASTGVIITQLRREAARRLADDARQRRRGRARVARLGAP